MKNVFRGMNRAMLFTVVLCTFVVVVSLVSASYFIFSNTVTENVSAFTVTLVSSNLNPNQYDIVTFSATLDYNGNPAGAGRTVHFYQGATEIGTGLTDINGVATFEYNMTNVGALDFKAGFEVP